MDLFCEDLLENILARVPLKPRTRFKRVSKRWHEIITNLRKFKPSTTSSGLVLTLEPFELESNFAATFLPAQDKGKPCILKTTFDVNLNDKRPILMVSFNGLLLYRVLDNVLPSTIQFYVSSRVVVLNNQYFPLPPIPLQHYHRLNLFVGLFPHEWRQDQFKVIWLSINHKSCSGFMDFNIFSSDTWAWTTNHRARIFNAFFFRWIYDDGWHKTPYSVYSNGKLYWPYSQKITPLMFVYNIKGQFFKLVGLPNVNPNQCTYLYESEGRLYYCEMRHHHLVIWAYLGGDDDDNDNNDDYYIYAYLQIKWRITHSIPMCELTKQTSETCGAKDETKFRPVAFNDELQILYLLKRGFVWAYSLETRKITKVWSSPVGSNGTYFRFDILPIMFDP